MMVLVVCRFEWGRRDTSPSSPSFVPGLFPLPPPLGGEGEGSLRLPRVFFNTSSEWPRRPDERCRPARTNRPPPSGEDGYVYPTGTASSVSWRVTHTHRVLFTQEPLMADFSYNVKSERPEM